MRQGAGLASVTVPTELFPPSTDVPTRARLKVAGAVIPRLAFWLVPFAVAVIVEVVFVVTAVVETVKVPVVAPAATVPEPVTVADGEPGRRCVGEATGGRRAADRHRRS